MISAAFVKGEKFSSTPITAREPLHETIPQKFFSFS
jgi:hypothetical protein